MSRGGGGRRMVFVSRLMGVILDLYNVNLIFAMSGNIKHSCYNVSERSAIALLPFPYHLFCFFGYDVHYDVSLVTHPFPPTHPLS